MRRRWLVVGAVVASLVLIGVVLASGWRSSPSLSSDERAVVDEVERGHLLERPAEAARYVEDNIALLLLPDVASELATSDLAELFEVALASEADEERVLDRIVAGVANEGAIHSPDLLPLFGEAVAANMAWFDTRINAPFSLGIGDLPEDVRRRYVTAHDFLRETMRDRRVAMRVRASMSEFARAGIAGAPEGGDERSRRLAEIGRVQAVFTLAQINAEMAEAREEGEVDGIDAASAAGNGLRSDDSGDSATWLALAAFGSPDPAVRSAARAQAAGHPFLDANGQLKTQLNQSETDALREWATRQTMSGGILEHDSAFIDAGGVDVRSATIVPSLDERL